MGLYDELTIEIEGFPEKYKGKTFQTKDLYRNMDTFKVRGDGSMYRLHEERRMYKCKESPLGFRTEVIRSKWLRKADIEGSIVVYLSAKKDMWVEFRLNFEEGWLRSWKRVLAHKKKKGAAK